MVSGVRFVLIDPMFSKAHSQLTLLVVYQRQVWLSMGLLLLSHPASGRLVPILPVHGGGKLNEGSADA